MKGNLGNMSEWLDKYNPFNSMKALVHVEYWKQIFDKNIIPPPRFVSIDPCGICDLACKFCNSSQILNKHHSMMNIELIDKIINVLNSWSSRACCIGGGGESLLNDNYKYLIDKLNNIKIEIGIVTNGTHLEYNQHTAKCKWIGISIDSASKETYSLIKGVKDSIFNKVIDNVSNITNKNIEITYKFLLHPLNYNEVYDAIKLAKNIGCNLIHIRPGADPWFNNDNQFNFTQDMITEVANNIEKARKEFETDNFKIYGITHKFNSNWSIKKTFKNCYACLTTCSFDSRGMVNLCCDRRGDEKVDLCHIDDLLDTWGSEKHKTLQKSINVNKCCKCTYSSLNEIFENVIIDDKMMCNLY